MTQVSPGEDRASADLHRELAELRTERDRLRAENARLSRLLELRGQDTTPAAEQPAAPVRPAGLVTMTMVFTAVHLPPSYIALLLTVDWFLDRCRTTINVMGDMNVSCLLDGKRRESITEVSEPTSASSELAAPSTVSP